MPDLILLRLVKVGGLESVPSPLLMDAKASPLPPTQTKSSSPSPEEG